MADFLVVVMTKKHGNITIPMLEPFYQDNAKDFAWNKLMDMSVKGKEMEDIFREELDWII